MHSKSTFLTSFVNNGGCTFDAMPTQRLLNSVLSALLAYNLGFCVVHAAEQSRAWRETLQGVQAVVNILEFLAVATLFVDLVIRYDRIDPRWQVARVAGVGICVAGMLFKWFVLYLHLSYLVD